jgi:uncharacterized membrane protein YphA (DoxX/SURF4 family)
MQKETKKLLAEICRYLLGVVFVFSGFVKAIDPLGGAYKILEYLRSFGQDWLAAVDLPMSFVQAALEFTVGICLLLGVYRQRTTLITLIIMLFMTPLTLYIAIKNPVTDCGCFGDALVISNWATFFKNIVLLAAAIWLYLNFKLLNRLFHRKMYMYAFIWTVVFITGFSLYCYVSLPAVDFRPYKIGVNIKEKMEIPADAPQSQYETTLIYAKNGVNKEFSIENYPKGDSTWVFVNSKSKLKKQGYVPPIHDFSITTEDGEDVTEQILENPSYTFLLISKKIEEASENNIGTINDLYDFSKKYGYEFYALTASLPDDIEDWEKRTGAEYPFCTTDETTLKTIIRSNPGLLLLKNGTILNKWSGNFLPDGKYLDRPLEETSLGQKGSNHSFWKILLAALILALPIGYLYFYANFLESKKHSKHKKHNHYLEDIKKKQEENEYKLLNKNNL